MRMEIANPTPAKIRRRMKKLIIPLMLMSISSSELRGRKASAVWEAQRRAKEGSDDSFGNVCAVL